MLSMETMDKMSAFDRDCQKAENVNVLEKVILGGVRSLCIKTLSYFHHPPFNEVDGGPKSARIA